MSDQDPAVSTWSEALQTQLSTSGIARQLNDELQRLQAAYNAELAARVAAERELAEAQDSFEATHADLMAARANLRADLQKAERERDEARAERDTLREVSRGNKQHVAVVTEENERLRAERDRARALLAGEGFA